MKKRPILSSVLNNKGILWLLSFAIAVFAWLFVAYTVSPDAERILRDVPILLDEKDASYKTYGLHLVEDGAEPTIDVTIRGARAQLNLLTSSDIRIVPNYSGVTLPGTYTLSLVATKVNVLQSITIVSLSENRVTVSFDVALSKKMQIEPQIEGMTVAEGLIGGTVNVTPAEVFISGPEAEVSSISRVIAPYVVPSELTERAEVTSDLVLLDAAGNAIPKDRMTLSVTSAELTIPVYTKGTLPFAINFINIPEGFDVSTLEYTVAPKEIDVAADAMVIDRLSTKVVGTVDLGQFALGQEYLFDVNLPSGMINLDDVETVQVSFRTDQLSSRKIRVTEFFLDNAPPNYKVDILTDVLPNVTVIGAPDLLKDLLPTSVVAVVDMLQTTPQSGEYNALATFRIPAYDSLWVAGTYHVLISVTPNNGST